MYIVILWIYWRLLWSDRPHHTALDEHWILNLTVLLDVWIREHIKLRFLILAHKTLEICLILNGFRAFRGISVPNFAWFDLFLGYNFEILLFEANLLSIVVFISIYLQLVKSIHHNFGVLINLVSKSIVELFDKVGSSLVSSTSISNRLVHLV